MDSFEAYCKRGHWAGILPDTGWNPAIHRGRQDELDKFCQQCGAGVIAGCVECGAGFPMIGAIAAEAYAPPFCRKCGSPQPWTSRQARVLQLTNLLEDEQLDSATMLAVREAIAELAGVVAGDESDADLADQQVEATEKLQQLAPGAWEFIKPVLQTLLTAAAKAKLGL